MNGSWSGPAGPARRRSTVMVSLSVELDLAAGDLDGGGGATDLDGLHGGQLQGSATVDLDRATGTGLDGDAAAGVDGDLHVAGRALAGRRAGRAEHLERAARLVDLQAHVAVGGEQAERRLDRRAPPPRRGQPLPRKPPVSPPPDATP